MTREETIQVLSILKAAYPNSYKGMTKQEANGVISVWATQFATVPLNVVLIAVNKLVAINPFPPAISDVREKIKGLYYESTAELLMNTELSEDNVRMLNAIRDGCQGFGKEPSLIGILGGNKKLMIGDGINETK